MSHVTARVRRTPQPSPGSLNHESIATKVERRRVQQLFRSLVIYAKMLGLRWNVRVVFDAGTTTAKTNGEVIYIRPLQIGNESDAVLMECLVDHEAGVHCRQTDFELMHTRFGDRAPELLTTLHNVFEDIWGERELKKIKPGCARSIYAGLAIMVERGIFGPPKENAHISSLLVGGLVNGLRSRKLGQTMLEPFFVQRWQQLEQHFGKELADKIWQEAQKVDQCFNTGAAIDLAESIMQMLRDFLKQQPPEPQKTPTPQPQQGDGDNNKSGQSTHEKPDGKPDDKPDQSNDAPVSSDGQPGQPQDGASPSNDQGDPQPGTDPQANDGDPSGEPESGEGQGTGQGQDGTDSDGKPSHGSSGGSPESGSKPQSGGQPGSATNDPQSGDSSDPQGGESNPGSQGAESSGQDPSTGGSAQQARSNVCSDPKKPTSKPGKSTPSNPGTHTEPGTANPQGAPDQNPISTNGSKGDSSPERPGPAAPQPAPMTPEQFNDALKAVMSTINATHKDAGTGELADAMSEALGASTATADARKAGISAGNNWNELDSSDLAENNAVDEIISEIARPIALSLGSKLDALLEAKVTSNSYLKRQGGRMHSGKLVGLRVSGNQNVYKASDDIEEIATVVHVLTDISSSMGATLGRSKPEPAASPSHSSTQGNHAAKKPARPVLDNNRIGAAAAVSRALGDIFHRFDVPFALSYFGGCLTKVKGYEDNWRRKRNVYWTRLEGNTCTDQALIGVIPQLASRIEERKVLILITDGVPAHSQAAALALSEARKLGIDVCVVIVTSNDSTDIVLNAFKAELDKWEIPHSTAKVFEELAQAVFNAVQAAF